MDPAASTAFGAPAERLPRTDTEREHPLLEVPVVRHDPPPDAVVTVPSASEEARARVRSSTTCGRPARTEPPPFATTAFPGPALTESSKRTRTSVGAVPRIAPSFGEVETRFAWARADGASTAAAASRAGSANRRRTSPCSLCRLRNLQREIANSNVALNTYVAMLRGINLGAHNRIAMADLRALFEVLGAEDVRTYVQSGNVVFRSRDARAGLTQSDRAEHRPHARPGRDCPAEDEEAAHQARRRQPVQRAGHRADDLHVTFLADRPSAGRARELDGMQYEPDEFRVIGRDVYLHCPNGYGRTKLSNAFFEKQLGVSATTRNWKTVNALAALANPSE